MRNKQAVQGALTDHQSKHAMLKTQPQKLEEVAKNLGWSIEYAKGYLKGVEFAYKWVLEEA